MTKPRTGARPAWAPSSWESGEIEELDMRPYDLARRVREHTGEGLIELDDPGEDPAPPPARAPAGAGSPDAPAATGSREAAHGTKGADGPTGAGEPHAQAVGGGTAAWVEDVLERLTSAMREQIAHRAQAVGAQLVAGSRDLRHLESELHERGFEPIASVVGRVSQGAEHLGRSLAEGDADRVAERMRELPGADPWRIVAGGFTAGLLAARAWKSYRADRPPAD